MNKSTIYAVLISIVCLGCSAKSGESESTVPHVVATDEITAGRYLTIVSGCNDCHTDGYMMTEGNVPEEEWLTGSPIGWYGPWGTTYPANLRLRVHEWSEDQWVQVLQKRSTLPPMPWMNVKQMSEEDMRAVYKYIRSLGAKGDHMPVALAPGVDPQTPYLSLFPQNMPTAANE